MRIVYFSKGVRGRVCLNELVRCGHEIVSVVVTQAEEALAALCTELGLSLVEERAPNSAAFAERLAGLKADLFVCSGYSTILKPVIFEIPPRGTINLHGGRLPQYRGAAPINWQIINGEVVGGCCVLFVDEGIDTAPILRQELYDIAEDDTHQSILDKTLHIFPRLLREVVGDLERGAASAVPQDRNDGCYYSRRFPDDSRINWSSSTDRQVHNLVRGMQGPFPHAFTHWGDEVIEIERTSLLRETIKGMPGRVALKRPEGVVVVCSDRGVLVSEIRRRGQIVKARDVIKTGDRFA